MATIKVSTSEISLAQMRNAVIVYGAISSGLYILWLLLMRAAGLMHVTELRFVNYLILFFVGMAEIRRWIKQRHSYVPFLQVYGTVLSTGIFSFLLFSVFLFFYNRYDIEMAELFTRSTRGVFPQMPSIVILFEGTAASIIVAFINMQYYRRYEEGEKSAA